MYTLILSYLIQLDNTYYKNSYKVHEFLYRGKYEIMGHLMHVNICAETGDVGYIKNNYNFRLYDKFKNKIV